MLSVHLLIVNGSSDAAIIPAAFITQFGIPANRLLAMEIVNDAKALANDQRELPLGIEILK